MWTKNERERETGKPGHQKIVTMSSLKKTQEGEEKEEKRKKLKENKKNKRVLDHKIDVWKRPVVKRERGRDK